jgi:hypothetical protein
MHMVVVLSCDLDTRVNLHQLSLRAQGPRDYYSGISI